jgi:hypothetical protein
MGADGGLDAAEIKKLLCKRNYKLERDDTPDPALLKCIMKYGPGARSIEGMACPANCPY